MIVPNYSGELEQRVLETLMHHGSSDVPSVQKAMLNLTSDTFYRVDHKVLFTMIRDSFHKGQPFGFVDMLTSIPREDNELYMTLHELVQQYGQMPLGVSYLDSDVSRLNVLMRLRKQMALAQNMIQEVSECRKVEEAQEILNTALTEISGLTYRESKHGITNMEIAEDYFDGKIAEEMKIPTTCDQLNRLLEGGIMPKSLIIVAAGASVGKTGFAIYLTDIIARAQPDRDSLFFSIEMESKHIGQRHIGVCGGKPFDKLTYQERLDAVTKMSQVPIRIYDTTMCHAVSDIDFILTTARLRAMEKPISVIVVDYLGLVETKLHFERNDLKQSYITGKLAQLAIELNCTVIALSQINRGAANRGVEDRCPWPHDAADSSGGHRSSSLWFGVDRPELYQDDPCYRNQFVVKCRKNRFGDTFETIFAFNGGSFAEVPQGWFKQPMAKPKSSAEATFSARGKDIYQD